MRAGICGLCRTEHGEKTGGERSAPSVPVATAIEPEPLVFADVLAELRALVDLATTTQDRAAVATAGARAERLLGQLRSQFIRDLGAPVTGPVGRR